MFSISVKFITGKYHATPWGRFANEGVPEWPPSPYRLARAIIAGWKYNHPNIKEAELFPIISKISSAHPSFYLPAASVGHTRHYMPPQDYAPQKITAATPNLIFDTFTITDKTQNVYFIWQDIELSNKEQDILEKIFETIHYLGRAESWCDITLEKCVFAPNCFPLTDTINGGDYEMVEVLVTEPTVRMADLCTTTDDLRKNGKIYPDGTDMITYMRSADCFSSQYEKKSRKHNAPVHVVRYAITNTIKPLVTNTLHVAEMLRSAAISQYKKRNDNECSLMLAGKDNTGKSIEGHKHAFYLPTDEDMDGRIDHLTIISTHIDMEQNKELDSLLEIRDLRDKTYREERRLNIVLEGYGKLEDFKNVPIFKKAKRWRSIVPFVLSHHATWRRDSENKKHIDSPEKQIKTEIFKRYDTQNVRVSFINPKIKMARSMFYPFEFYRIRKSVVSGGGAYNTILEFTDAISGPLTLGYASHFGLGLFVPDDTPTH